MSTEAPESTGRTPKPGEYPCPSGRAKRQYETKAAAAAHRTSININGSAKGGRRGSTSRNTCYRCDYCGFWHVGRR